MVCMPHIESDSALTGGMNYTYVYLMRASLSLQAVMCGVLSVAKK